MTPQHNKPPENNCLKETCSISTRVDGDDVIFRFNGGEKEEAELLTDLVASGALIHNYMRDQADIEEIFRR